ncbi:MAG: nucleoside 2-deoxyribosyltransferase domain-containing protein [Bacteroidetes bacterium]|uniref:Nucleoside 2-deoxyribosyltransferase domain-containing protein n=1 Tax=Candidatus Cryptobacteroides intestinigallinarum TaxID=2840767 RepID=A0A9D9HJY4_9BACT|nr:nucleoside 2-deoxyribosyltransferase domain-containing protein [Candidatus Cryptobacteroides intestinigallinarum]
MKNLIFLTAALLISAMGALMSPVAIYGQPSMDGQAADTDGLSCAYMLKPHQELPVRDTSGFTKVFLAGTIDMGNSRDWQSGMLEYFAAKDGRYLLFNPRQDSWNAEAEGEMDYQVNWELRHLEEADIIIMYIIGTSKSPVTLLEMGLHARSRKLIVACEKDYYRYDNVRITCGFYGIPLYNSLDQLLEVLDNYSY